jgi:hypothetical protein
MGNIPEAEEPPSAADLVQGFELVPSSSSIGSDDGGSLDTVRASPTRATAPSPYRHQSLGSLASSDYVDEGYIAQSPSMASTRNLVPEPGDPDAKLGRNGVPRRSAAVASKWNDDYESDDQYEVEHDDGRDGGGGGGQMTWLRWIFCGCCGCFGSGRDGDDEQAGRTNPME